jgi:hypothetical protein
VNGLTLKVQPGPDGDPGGAVLVPLPRGDAGTDATVGAMWALAIEASRHPLIRALARGLERAAGSAADAVFYWQRRAYKFVRDPDGVEYLRHPASMVQAWQRAGPGQRVIGDCDDRTTLAVAVLLAMGSTPAIAVVGKSATGPFEHVYPGVLDGDVFYPIDAQERDRPGAEVAYTRRRIFRNPETENR